MFQIVIQNFFWIDDSKILAALPPWTWSDLVHKCFIHKNVSFSFMLKVRWTFSRPSRFPNTSVIVTLPCVQSHLSLKKKYNDS